MEVEGTESGEVTHRVFLSRDATRFGAIPPLSFSVALRSTGPRMLIATTQILENLLSTAKTGAYDFPIANQMGLPRSRRKFPARTLTEGVAKFAGGPPRKCAKLISFNLQERFVLA